MKKYTLEDLNTFERNEDGFLQCPTGDYSEVKEFPDFCNFESGSIIGPCSRIGTDSKIGPYSKIGPCSRIGTDSIIGPYSTIGEGSTIGAYSKIGEGSIIGKGSIIGEDSKIEERTRIGAYSKIGADSIIGERISISEGVIIEPGCYIEDNKPLKQYCSMEGCGSKRRKTYFFLLTDNRIYIRCGCFAGYEDEFIKQLHETHKGKIFEKQYLAALELAKLTFQREEGDKAGKSKNEG